ncbi:MAG: hypothetical protein WAN10_13840 [Candidatus Acidiferrales bacterium]
MREYTDGVIEPSRARSENRRAVAPPPLPPPPKPIEDKEPQVTALLNNVLDQQAAGKVDLSLFTPDQQKILDARTQAALRDFFEDQGTLEKLELLNRTEAKGVRTYTYRAHFAYGMWTVTMKLASDGKIAGLDLLKK